MLGDGGQLTAQHLFQIRGVGAVAEQILSRQTDGAGSDGPVPSQHAADGVEDGGLSASAGADDAVDLTVCNGKGDILYRCIVFISYG